MKIFFDHQLIESFYFWIDHLLVNDGEGYCNFSGSLITGKTFKKNYYFYHSPQAQWVYDQSQTGANVPTGVTINGTFYGNNVSGVRLSYRDGGVYVPVSLGNNLVVEASYSAKEYNVYWGDEREESIVASNKWEKYPKSPNNLGPRQTDTKYLPAVYITYHPVNREALALGGGDFINNGIFKAFIFSEKSKHHISIHNLFQNQYNKHFAIYRDIPLESNFGGYKLSVNSFHYDNYSQNQQNQYNNLAYIQDLSITHLSESFTKNLGKEKIASVVEFDVQTFRN
ncbi:MAG: hypothetical protein HC836_12555 [Richelia sp. RM2_1_2]|nr:hypothetical protein [Richelia sp. RM2_1_2]